MAMIKVFFIEGLCNSGPSYAVIHSLVLLEGAALRMVLAFQMRKKKTHWKENVVCLFVFFFCFIFPVFKILGFYAFYKNLFK